MSRNGRWMDRDDESEGSWDDDAVDSTWAGGPGFAVTEVVHKWKGTRKCCFCWPLHSESLTVTSTEVHVKRNECPALPRECRPFRSWAVAPLYKISAFRMAKDAFKPLSLIVLLAVSAGIGFAAARLILYLTYEMNGLKGEYDFFIAGIVIVVVFCLGVQILNLCAPLRLLISVDGTHDWFGIDLVPGSVQPEEIKHAIGDAQAASAQA